VRVGTDPREFSCAAFTLQPVVSPSVRDVENKWDAKHQQGRIFLTVIIEIGGFDYGRGDVPARPKTAKYPKEMR
jgi:hypothetical protein